MSRVNCSSWTDCGVGGGGCCGKGLHNGRPSVGVCERICGQREPIAGWTPPPQTAPQRAARGIGDVVAGAIKFVTGGLVKPCGGCAKRQDALNKAFPFNKS